MMINIDEIYEIIKAVDCDDVQDEQSTEWKLGFNAAIVLFRMHVLELDKREEA